MNWIDQLPPDIRTFVNQLRDLPEFPEHLAAFAAVLRERQKAKASTCLELAHRAWELDPNNPRVRQAVEWAIRRSVPKWHFHIVHDQGRNDAYERALQRFVTPETIVLEIGTGTGILAMMAARIGAKHVYTCEMEPLVAQAAQQNIVSNGYTDRVTIIPKKSTDLVVGEDIPAPADLMVSEIVDNHLLGEDVLPIIEDAHARLLRSGALVLPAQVAARGTLVGGPPWSDRCRLGTISGFDLSAFNPLAPPIAGRPGKGNDLDDALSEDVELFRFDLGAPGEHPAEKKEITLTAVRDGVADGFLHWIWLHFAEDLQYHNRPPADTAWSPQLHVFPEPIPLQAGDTIRLAVEHTRRTITVAPLRTET